MKKHLDLLKQQLPPSFELQYKHVSNVMVDDIVLHDGLFRTVCKDNLSRCDFMGHSIFGDTFGLGIVPVPVAVYSPEHLNQHA